MNENMLNKFSFNLFINDYENNKKGESEELRHVSFFKIFQQCN